MWKTKWAWFAARVDGGHAWIMLQRRKTSKGGVCCKGEKRKREKKVNKDR